MLSSGWDVLSLVTFAILCGAVVGQSHHSTESGSIIVVNSGIEIAVGSTLFLDPEKHLRIEVGAGDRCVIRVIRSDLLTQSPGRLNPDEFPCRFGAHDVQYSHFGSRTPLEDRVRLLLRYDTADDTVIIPFALKVQVLLLDRSRVIARFLPLIVDRPGGRSNPIDARHVQFAYDSQLETCRVALVQDIVHLPRYGHLVNYVVSKDDNEDADQDRGMMTCDQFVNGDVRYEHTDVVESIDRDSVPMVVELSDQNGILQEQEHFQLTVRIKGARQNTPPKVNQNSLLLMDVSQFVMTAVTTDILTADDVESSEAELLFNVTSPFTDGVIVSTDDQNLPINTFTQKDIEDLKIAYKPPSTDADVRRIFPVDLQVVDGHGLPSEPFTLLVTVNAMNSMAPIVTRNTGISLFEGQARKLQSSKNLEISDEDNLDDVVVTVIEGLRHGQLLLLDVPVNRFTPADLDAGHLRYQHDGSDSFSDNIILRMEDGSHTVQFLFPVNIFPVDDDPPVLTVNTGLVLRKSAEEDVTPFELSATDADSDDDVIRYVLEDHSPLYGAIMIRSDGDTEKQGWTLREDGQYEKRVSEWTQLDLIEGRLFYRHLGEHHSQTVMDAVTFRLMDDSDPPNVSQMKHFLVKILPLDDIPPQLYPGTTLHTHVHEFELKELSRDDLRYTDTDSDDRLLRYTISKPPYDLDDNSGADAGRLVLTDDPETEVTTFTQAQVNHRRIAYRPPPVELGLARRVIRFEFQVEDAAGNVLDNQMFTVALQPVDNKPPTVIVRELRVAENGRGLLDTSVLEASDPDTDPHLLLFRLTESPRHGTLHKSDDDYLIVVGDRFRSEDSIVYVHNDGGDDTTEDVIKLELSDGAHVVPVTVHVTIVRRHHTTDDDGPRVFAPGVLRLELLVPEGQSTPVLEDPGKFFSGAPAAMTFVVEKDPRRGELQMNGRRVNRFTREDLEQETVRYHHMSGEIGRRPIEDAFDLTLSKDDEWLVEDSRVIRVGVNVTVEPVDNEPPKVEVLGRVTVVEGQKQVITEEQVTVRDVDSVEDDIVCLLLVQPVQGYVENVAPLPGWERHRAGIPITAFEVRHLKQGTVHYVQSIHHGIEPREDRFVLQCSDGSNTSPRLTVAVVIEPSNDERPQLILGDLSVIEGMHLQLDVSNIVVVDLDVPEDRLLFMVTRKPSHGSIVLQSPDGDVETDRFGMDEVRGHRQDLTVAYLHDDSETVSDEFIVELRDGKHVVEHVIRIQVISTDDETPRLTINAGLEVDVGDGDRQVIITNRVLKAEDVDSEDSDLVYILRMAPRHGTLVRLDPMTREVLVNLTVDSNFTQADIDHRLIEFGHLNDDGGGSDVFKFDVTDGTNVLMDCHFHVVIRGVDTIYPDVVNKGVTLPEGGQVTLTTDILSTSDLNSDDHILVFIVTRPPVRGHLENTDHRGMPVSSFDQMQLAGNKIVYTHTSDDEVKMDSFEFEVSDGLNSVFRTFRILLTDVDNQRPVLVVGKVVIREGGIRFLSPFDLKIIDRDTPDHLLRFSVTRMPMHGTILYDRTEHVTTFTMSDLEDSRISYMHDGSETLTDHFSVVISDGTHSNFYVHPNLDELTQRPQTVPVTVVPVDNGIPQVVINRGASTIGLLDDRYHLGFVFNNRVLRCDDRDSLHAELLYKLLSPPRHGRLLNKALNNVTITNFTQDDLDKQNVVYVLQKSSNATNDYFTFNVIDSGGNELTDQIFRLNWALISLEYDTYVVNETEMFLRVNLRRRGYLGETSFVGVNTVDLSTTRGLDYHKSFAKQVQFNPGQSESMWRVKIMPDSIYEKGEQFQIVLEEPIMAVLESPRVAQVTILDDEDESVVFLPEKRIVVEEDAGELNITVCRTGDLSEELLVLCSTRSGSATGTMSSSVLSYSDYISRPVDHTSAIRFDRLQDRALCRVIIIDDSLQEDEEQFSLFLSMAMGGRIGSFNTSQVFILQDHDDSPLFYFGESTYHVNESDGHLMVTVIRTGTDLSKESTVMIQSKPSDPPSAEAGQDYVGIGRQLVFAPGSVAETFRVTILDDLSQTRLETRETFKLVLRRPTNGIIGHPAEAVVVITDLIDDQPQMQFKDASYTVYEEERSVSAIIKRSGDTSHPSSVHCYTRQNTAHVQMDFEERPDTNVSLIVFSSGDVEKSCVVLLLDDHFYESDEDFGLELGSPTSSALGVLARLGPRNTTKIFIKDDADKPIIKFEKTRLNVREPKKTGDVSIVEVSVVRLGDTSKVSVIRVHTKDGSAKAGEDYHGLSKELKFDLNITRLTVLIEVLFDDEEEHRETFTVHLKPDRNMIAEIKDSKLIIYIEEDDSMADVTFPSPPVVVSLKDYDNIGFPTRSPIAGYPVVCVTPCNPKYPDYTKTRSLCNRENINDSLTEYRWLVGKLRAKDLMTASRLQDVVSNTFFTTTKRISLDSIYFNPGSRVQCAARAVNANGDPGIELFSSAVEISTSEGICLPSTIGSIGAESFTAKLRYTGPDDPGYPNLIKLSVIIPHRDGLLPVVSTQPLSSFELILSPNADRLGNHKCSNLLDVDEIETKHGFITSAVINPNVIGEVEPHQYNERLRSAPTLRFYRNLDLEACTWEFVSYYSMSELIADCGGTVSSNGQVLNLVQSHVLVHLPIYVSYVFHSAVGWQHSDLSSQLRLTFVYDTSVLWHQGIASPEESQFQGSLHPSSMNIQNDGCLVVKFRTEAHFYGQFVLTHSDGSDLSSMIISLEQKYLTFKLELLQSEPTFSNPQQEWQFVSDYAVRDYSGLYIVKLLPCSVPDHVVYSVPVVCHPKEPVDFELQIRFQQVSDPVATRYSLNTQFQLASSEERWSSNSPIGLDNVDVVFQPGDKIYGRIMIDPVQNLDQSFHVTVDKCFLCTGVDGYIPKYDPTRNEYGCMARSQNLLFSFKFIDKDAPNTVQKDFRNVSFEAVLAKDDVEKSLRQPGSDGFRLDSAPLFQAFQGCQWFIQCVYTVSSHGKTYSIDKRSSGNAIKESHSTSVYVNSSERNKRFLEDVDGIGRKGRGTNIHTILLDYNLEERRDEDARHIDDSVVHLVEEKTITPFMLVSTIAIVSLVTIFLVTVITVKCKQLCFHRHPRRLSVYDSYKCDVSQNIVKNVVEVKNGAATTVIVPRYNNSKCYLDSSEV